MKKYEFSQLNFTKAILLVIMTIFTSASLPFLIFGVDNVMNFIDSFPSTKLLGLSIGVYVVLPTFFLKKFMGDKIEISVANNLLQINKNNKLLKKTDLKNIGSLVFSDLSTKTLDIYLKDNTKFHHIRPNAISSPKQVEDINTIINLFKSELEFSVKKEIKKKGVGEYTAIEYTVINQTILR